MTVFKLYNYLNHTCYLGLIFLTVLNGKFSVLVTDILFVYNKLYAPCRNRILPGSPVDEPLFMT